MINFLRPIISFLQTYNGAVTAIATAIIAAFTIVLTFVTNRQAKLTKDAIELSRRELISNYRPRLRVRNVMATPHNPSMVYRIGIFQADQLVRGQLYVVNFGGSVATITESHCIVFWNKSGLPMRRPYEGESGNHQIPKGRLEAGQSTPGSFQSGEPMTVESAKTIGTQNGTRLYVMGWIEYADDLEIKRRMSFCHEYRRKDRSSDGRFYAVDDLDYEHEE